MVDTADVKPAVTSCLVRALARLQTGGWPLAWHSDQDLEALDEALLALPEANNPMVLPELDGFCAALIVCPTVVSPGEWLKQVWGPDGPPEFVSVEEMQHLIDLVTAHYNRVAGMLRRPEEYGPLIVEDPNTGEVFWEFWLDGFMRAVALYPDAWKKVIHSGDDGALAAMMSIMGLSRFARERASYSQEEQAERDREAPDQITECVLELNRYAKGKPSGDLFGGILSGIPSFNSPCPSFRAKKVGRNDPCPCGSGRKYKKCCGAN